MAAPDLFTAPLSRLIVNTTSVELPPSSIPSVVFTIEVVKLVASSSKMLTFTVSSNAKKFASEPAFTAKATFVLSLRKKLSSVAVTSTDCATFQLAAVNTNSVGAMLASPAVINDISMVTGFTGLFCNVTVKLFTPPFSGTSIASGLTKSSEITSVFVIVIATSSSAKASNKSSLLASSTAKVIVAASSVK